MTLLLIILLIVLLFGGGYGWHTGYPATAPYPYYGGFGLILLIIILLLLFRPIGWGWW